MIRYFPETFGLEIWLIEPHSVSRYTGEPYLHLFERCPSVQRAVQRDGEVSRTRATFADFINSETAKPCGWCRRHWDAGGAIS